MKEEDKILLLKDLCARLNTNLVCSIYRIDDIGIGYRDEILSGYCKGDIWYEFYFGDDCGIGIDNISKIKPYLFPMSSMTEEQEEELKNMYYSLVNGMFYYTERIFDKIPFSKMKYFPYQIEDFFIKNHIDYRGLINKGLALDATNKNIY